MESQDATQLLAQLRGLHLPTPPEQPALWPLIVAAIIIIAGAAALLVRFLKNRDSWATTATRELLVIQRNSESTATLQTAELLKRIIITHDKNPTTKQLTGNQWLAYLDKFFNTRFFSTGPGRLFGDDLYQSGQQSLSPQIYKSLKKLIRKRKWQHD